MKEKKDNGLESKKNFERRNGRKRRKVAYMVKEREKVRWIKMEKADKKMDKWRKRWDQCSRKLKIREKGIWQERENERRE